jgi:hypothetical protein
MAFMLTAWCTPRCRGVSAGCCWEDAAGSRFQHPDKENFSVKILQIPRALSGIIITHEYKFFLFIIKVANLREQSLFFWRAEPAGFVAGEFLLHGCRQRGRAGDDLVRTDFGTRSGHNF